MINDGFLNLNGTKVCEAVTTPFIAKLGAIIRGV